MSAESSKAAERAREYVRICDEHEIELNEDGTCPQCRDYEGKPFVLDMQSYYLKPVRSWGEIVRKINLLRDQLNDKPASEKIGYSRSPGGILNAYREGDLSFDEAVSQLQVKPLFLSSFCKKEEHVACYESRRSGFADNPCLLCQCKCHAGAAIRAMKGEHETKPKTITGS